MLKFLAIAVLSAISAVQAGEMVRGVWREPGDIMLGFVVAAHDNNASMTTAYDPRYACGSLVPNAALLVPAFRQAIARINANKTRLQGLTLGYDIIDSCKLPTHAVDLATPWAVAKVMRLQDPASAPAPPVAVIGAYNSRVTAPLAVMLQQFDIPMFDYASTSSDLSDRRRYPLYARTSPSDIYQAFALAALANKMNHKCVHVVYSEGLYGQLGFADLKKNLVKLDIRIASETMAKSVETADQRQTFDAIVANITRTSSAKAVICFCEDTTVRQLLQSIRNRSPMPQLQLLLSDFAGVSMDLTGLEAAAEGAVTVTVGSLATAAHDTKAFSDMAKDGANQDPYFQKVLQQKFNCTFDQAKVTRTLPRCNTANWALTAADLPASSYLGGMLQTVDAVVSGIETWIKVACSNYANKTECLPTLNAGQDAYALVSMVLGPKTPGLFDKNGDGPANYDFNWYSARANPRYTVVASWRNSTLSTPAAFTRLPKLASTC